MIEEVSIVRCNDYQDQNTYRKVKEAVTLLGGIERFVSKGERVLLKPNLLIGRSPEKCVNTHPAVVKAVASLVLEAGARPVIGDSPQMGSALKVASKCGVGEIAHELGIEIVEFEPVEVKYPEGKFFKKFIIGKVVREVDKIINIPKLKTHTLTLLTLAVKNIFGCIPGTRKAQWHVQTSQAGTEYFAKMLLDLYTLINPVLTVVDGINAMEGKGPGFGNPRHLGLLLAATDGIAADAVIAKILGAQADRFPTLKVALNEHYENARPENIKMLGETIDAVMVSDFQFPPRITEMKGFLRSFMGFLKGPLTTHPTINNQQCKNCGNCFNACPLSCIAAFEGGLIINTKNCIQCLCCMEVCPEGAVDLEEGSLLKLFTHLKK